MFLHMTTYFNDLFIVWYNYNFLFTQNNFHSDKCNLLLGLLSYFPFSPKAACWKDLFFK